MPPADHPVSAVQWVPLAQVEPNDYNPNHVAPAELQLLALSIQHDGYTQPIVTVYDSARDKYIIVDGFHRYYVCRHFPAIAASTDGLVPIVVLQQPLSERMAATVRHNRARGKHAVHGMAGLIFRLCEHGWDDAAICTALGMEPEELLRLKHVTGFSKLFADHAYKQAWQTKNQLLALQRYQQSCIEE